MTIQKTAVLLVNLGTPEAPTEDAVRQYLAEFLADPRVVTIPRFIWWFILKFFVLRTRPALSAKAYQKVWRDDGSPLMVYSKKIQQALQALAEQQAEGQYDFILGMRYGQPSIESAIDNIKQSDADNIILLPLYPQFATSSTGTAWHEFKRVYEQWKGAPASQVIMDYHNNPKYITALANSVQQHWLANERSECLLVSFHGVPERTIRQGDPYLEQCTETARLLAQELSLDETQWRLVFQSRFGRAQWIQPYCVDTLQQLPNEGIKHIDVICPGFAADCLETLEEIAIQNRAIFMAAGGESYEYIPALNNTKQHIEALFELVEALHMSNETNKEVTGG